MLSTQPYIKNSTILMVRKCPFVILNTALILTVHRPLSPSDF